MNLTRTLVEVAVESRRQGGTFEIGTEAQPYMHRAGSPREKHATSGVGLGWADVVNEWQNFLLERFLLSSSDGLQPSSFYLLESFKE